MVWGLDNQEVLSYLSKSDLGVESYLQSGRELIEK